MDEVRIGPTANRSVVGVMAEFVRLAQKRRGHSSDADMIGLAMWLSTIPAEISCSANVAAIA